MGIRQLLRRQRPEDGPRLADDGTLTVVGSSFDPARADAVVVGEMADRGVDLTRPLLLRHHLRLPDAAAVEDAEQIVAQEGYSVRAEGLDAPEESAEAGVRVRVSRPQQITAIAIGQERSRMVALTQQLGGEIEGWDVLSPR